MEQKNYYVALTYDLKVGQEDELMESTTPENPFTFYTGLGMVLEDFEKAIMACEVNGEFDFTIPAERAYGEYDDESVIDLPKNIFEVNGKIDEEILFEGNIVFSSSPGSRSKTSPDPQERGIKITFQFCLRWTCAPGYTGSHDRLPGASNHPWAPTPRRFA